MVAGRPVGQHVPLDGGLHDPVPVGGAHAKQVVAGAEVVASQRITADVVNDALAALGDDES